ncbi:MAG: methyltransferase domain-containing protein [Dissulfuribacterales bacterium]
MNDTKFYHAFETKHRGSRELIKERLKVYLPFLLPLKAVYDASMSLDLGCGRGEWLELMQENGFQPFGVDMDDGMLSECRERKLPVATRDAVSYLKNATVDSYVVVTAFHLVEHLPVQKVHDIISGALRVLKPGGILILETPNPENIRVATTNFYLDPTHVRPIPPLLLEFLAEYHGFARVKVLRLQEPSDISKEGMAIRLMDVLSSVSPDYAIVAQKAAEPQIMGLFDEAFHRNYGISLEEIAGRFDRDVEANLTAIHMNVNELKQKAETVIRHITELNQETKTALKRADALGLQTNRLEDRLASSEVFIGQVETKTETIKLGLTDAIDRLNGLEEGLQAARERAESAEKLAVNIDEQCQSLTTDVNGLKQKTGSLAIVSEEQACRIKTLEAKMDEIIKIRFETQEQYEAKFVELSGQLNALYNSISWRITKPLRTPPVRFLYRQIVRIREQGLVGRTKFIGGKLLKIGAGKCIHFLQARPHLYDTALKWLHRLGVYERARAFYRRYGANENRNAPQAENQPPVPMEFQQLSPRARQIYLQLKDAIERHKNERNKS